MEPHSFEAVEAELDQLNTAVYSATTATDAESRLQVVCEVWRAAAPVVRALAAIPFLPAHWRTALNLLIGMLDQLCPASP